jgi:ketosteroid isomerase-like protein
MKRILTALALMFFVAAPAFAEDTEAVSKQLGDAWLAAYNKGDAKALAALYASDAWLMPPGADKPIVGNENIEKFYQEFVKNKLTNAAVPTTERTDIDPKTFYIAGTWSGDAGKQHIGGLWFNVVEKEGADWKIRVDIWNMPPPAPPKEAAASATTGSGSTTPNKQ